MSGRDEIEAKRREIDRIDDSIVDLLVARARCAIEIGELKRQEKTPVRDPAREAEVLARLKKRAKGKLDASAIESVWERIMDLTRRLQEQKQERVP
jgi:chorismate mutase